MKKIVQLVCLLATSIGWASNFEKCADSASHKELEGSECAIFSIPKLHDNNVQNKIDLFVRKFPALNHNHGTVWLISGGPGESGASFYSNIDLFRKKFSNYDLLVPDHRGTGYSTSICPSENIDSVAGKNIVGEEWQQCFDYMYSNLPHVGSFSITNAAKDLRYLMDTLSTQGKTFIYGVSYGTQLILRTAQLEELKVDGIILDSLVPMQDDPEFELSKRSNVVNSVGKQLLAKCTNSNSCAGHDSKSLILSLNKLIGHSNSLKNYSKTLPDHSFSNTLGIMLDIPYLRNEIPTIISDLMKNDSRSLENAVKEVGFYYAKFNSGYPNFGSSIPLVQIITASENNLRPSLTKENIAAEEKTMLFTSPLPQLMAGASIPTYPKDNYFAKLPQHLPRTLILHGTLDPKTHYDGAKSHANALSSSGEISFVSVLDAPHFIALNAPRCFTQQVTQFIDGKNRNKAHCEDEQSMVKFSSN